MNFDKYKNPIPCPTRPSRPVMRKNSTSYDYRNFADELERYEKQDEIFQKQFADYMEKERDILTQFKEDVLQENGLKGHPNAEKVWSKAWENGQYDGLVDVAYWVHELAEVVL